MIGGRITTFTNHRLTSSSIYWHELNSCSLPNTFKRSEHKLKYIETQKEGQTSHCILTLYCKLFHLTIITHHEYFMLVILCTHGLECQLNAKKHKIYYTYTARVLNENNICFMSWRCELKPHTVSNSLGKCVIMSITWREISSPSRSSNIAGCIEKGSNVK
jgi:hypothetical protein